MAPKAVNAVEALQPDRSLSRAWPAPTKALLFAKRVDHPPPPCRRGSWPRKRWIRGNVSTGTIAFAGMARSYKKSVTRSRGSWCIHRSCRRGPWPRKRGMRYKRSNRNRRSRGHGPLLQKAWPDPATGGASTPCRRGPWPRKQSAKETCTTPHHRRAGGGSLQPLAPTPQKRKYLCAIGSTFAGSQRSSTPSARTS